MNIKVENVFHSLTNIFKGVKGIRALRTHQRVKIVLAK